MNFQVSEVTIASICEPFEVQNDEIHTWCDWMRNFHLLDEAVRPREEEGIEIKSAREVAIVGARNVFFAKGRELVGSLSQMPNFESVLTSVRDHVLHIEGSVIPVSEQLKAFFTKTKKKDILRRLTVEPGRNIVTNANASYAQLQEFIANTFTGDKCLYNNQTDEGLTEDRYELLKLLRINVRETKVDFSTWNQVILEGIVRTLDGAILGRVAREKKEKVVNNIRELLTSNDFTSVTTAEMTKLISVLEQYVFTYILQSAQVKLKPAESKGRSKLSPADIDMILNGVTYNGVHPLIAKPIEENMRRTLRARLEKLEIEKKFVPEIAHSVRTAFENSRLRQGARVGIIAAMSIGEDSSQAGLRAFYHAGVTVATGFERVKQVTDNPAVDKATGGFTTIGIKGNPDETQANIYANLIEETKISDLCEITVGRRDAFVPEISTEFGETPIFEAVPGGWQDRAIAIIHALTSLRDQNVELSRPPTTRPKWIIRLTCDKNKMFLKRFTPTHLAQIIESSFLDIRAIPSDFSTGLVDLYANVNCTDNVNFGIDPDYAKLSMKVVQNVANKIVQGIPGFTKALVEKFEFSKFIVGIQSSGSRHVVTFHPRDVRLNGVTSEDLETFLKVKVGSQAKVTAEPNWTFQVDGFEGKLRERILAPETVRLVDLVDRKEESPEVYTVFLNRKKILEQEDVSVEDMMSFFEKQKDLATFAPVDVTFDRVNFTVKITRARSFTPPAIAATFEKFGLSTKISFTENSIVYENVSLDADFQRLQTAVRSYGLNVKARLEREAKRLVITLHPMSLSGAWSLIESTQDCSSTSYITFPSRRRERACSRYRIMAKGIGIEDLAMMKFVNIYATHSSIPREHYKFFDIEVARDYINSELVRNVGADIGDRHLGLISDIMCYMGTPIKLKLSGKRATAAGPLATAYFQESYKLLMDAAAGYQVDNLTSSVGMTLIGDFQRGHYSVKEEKEEDDKTESAIDLLTACTVTTRKVVKKKKGESKQEPDVVPPGNVNLFEGY
jgi:hypothetical protein